MGEAANFFCVYQRVNLAGLSGHVPYWRSHLGPDVPQWINLMGGEQGELLVGVGPPATLCLLV